MRKTVRHAVCILLILILGVSTALLAYLHFGAADSGNLSGEWTAELDMTEQAAMAAYIWLRDIEAVSVTLEETESRMQDLSVQVELIFEQTSRQGGTFYSSVLPESYEACRQAAYEALAEEFRVLVSERLRMAGYGDGADGSAAEALAAEAFGMSTVSWLMSCGPALLPSLEELQARYDGSGNYEAADGILIRQFKAGACAGTKAESYIRKDSGLILSGEADESGSGRSEEHYPVMYTLKQPANQ